MKVRYTPEAYSDREEIFEYLKVRSVSGARKVMASLGEAVKRLEDQPFSGYATDNPNVRVIFIVRYPYKIFYRVRDEVEILHIRHTSRRT